MLRPISDLPSPISHLRSLLATRRQPGLAAREQATDVDPKAWCLAYIVPRPQLYIYNFDRAILGLNGHSPTSLIQALGELGKLQRVEAPWSAPGTPSKSRRYEPATARSTRCCSR